LVDYSTAHDNETRLFYLEVLHCSYIHGANRHELICFSERLDDIAEDNPVRCLDAFRDLRIAYILGDLREMTDKEGAEALRISPAAFRKRVERARTTVRPIIAGRCRCRGRRNRPSDSGC
jgi:hypothetical protein